jgi:hypothetical protein
MELYFNTTLVKISSYKQTITMVGIRTLVLTIVIFNRHNHIRKLDDHHCLHSRVAPAHCLQCLYCKSSRYRRFTRCNVHVVICCVLPDSGLNWTLGHVVCKTYLVVDFTLSLESVLTILLISGDRFLLLKDGTRYQSRDNLETICEGECDLVMDYLPYRVCSRHYLLGVLGRRISDSLRSRLRCRVL